MSSLHVVFGKTNDKITRQFYVILLRHLSHIPLTLLQRYPFGWFYIMNTSRRVSNLIFTQFQKCFRAAPHSSVI